MFEVAVIFVWGFGILVAVFGSFSFRFFLYGVCGFRFRFVLFSRRTRVLFFFCFVDFRD